MRRIVFVILPDRVRVAAIHDTHADWFKRLGLDATATLQTCTRGYVDDRGVHVYRTADFTADENDLTRMAGAMERLAERLPWLRDDAPVIAGYDPAGIAHYLGGPRERVVGTVRGMIDGQWTGKTAIDDRAERLP